MRIGRQSSKRPKSPITVVSDKQILMCRNGIIDNTMKINRIPLIRTSVVEYLGLESPSCIWVRLPNHITPNLVITDLKSLTKVTEEIQEFDYFLAPIEEGVFARCRVIKKESNTMRVLVMFIDHGVKAWIGRNVLAEMPSDFLPYHPWQAICISIHGLKMQGNPALEARITPKWNTEHAHILREIMGFFNFFRTKTIFSSEYCNDYREPNKVELFGLRGADDEIGVSIAHIFTSKLGNLFVIPINVFDASTVQSIDNCDPEKCDESSIPIFQKEWPVDDDNSDDEFIEPVVDNWSLWCPEKIQIPLLTPEWLCENGYAFGSEGKKQFLLSIEGQHTQSPYEWYGRPIKAKTEGNNTNKFDNMSLMLEADEFLKSKSDMLDVFYSKSANRHQMDRTDISKWLKNGLAVYAIFGTSEERALYTGEWQRVQVVSCDESSCIIRYLDSGGRELVVPSQLYKIHTSHCTYPPLCGQFCLQGYKDVDPKAYETKKKWSKEAIKAWNILLRVDLPVSVEHLGMLNAPQLKTGVVPYEENHVLCAKRVSISGIDLAVELTQIDGPGGALIDVTAPVTYYQNV